MTESRNNFHAVNSTVIVVELTVKLYHKFAALNILRWCYRLLGLSWMERKINKWLLDMIGSGFVLRRRMAESGEEYKDKSCEKTASKNG